MTKILFVCDANCNRSLTCERWVKKYGPQNYEVKSAGLYFGHGFLINEEILQWADQIYTMTLKQKMIIHKKYPMQIHKVEVIGIEDIYEPDEKELLMLIEYWWINK